MDSKHLFHREDIILQNNKHFTFVENDERQPEKVTLKDGVKLLKQSMSGTKIMTFLRRFKYLKTIWTLTKRFMIFKILSMVSSTLLKPTKTIRQH